MSTLPEYLVPFLGKIAKNESLIDFTIDVDSEPRR